MHNYINNKNFNGLYINSEKVLDSNDVLNSIDLANAAIKGIHESTNKFNINIFNILGLRNLSGFIGEIFAYSILEHSDGKLIGNLHQDGYPDLLLVNTKERLEYFETLYYERNGKKSPRDKKSFSPYKFGGIEIKASVGSVPPATETSPKLVIGEQRIHTLTSFDWKAHHTETNNLLAVLWDFIDELPTIVACFYRNDLEIDDWGKIVKPTEGGGRTTSVSVMKPHGILKMCKGWIAVIDDPLYIEKLSGKRWIGEKVST